ncbi:MAG: MATE family efflux transporter [Gammaproteobacteria bacterium]|nr:MATE family efflux transporter [Gammaproteobacteria bacterium]
MSDAYSHRAVWRIAAPMITSSVTVPLLGMVDTAVMGHLPESFYLGAVAAGATIFSVLFMGLNFLRMGTTGVTAQGYGAADSTVVREALGHSLLTAVVLSTMIIALQGPIIEVSLWLLAPSSEVNLYTREYFAIRVWSAPASLGNFVLIGWLIGMQNARGPLAIMLIVNFTNIALDLIFVLWLGMTAGGVALATLLAELIGFATGAIFVRAELNKHPGNWAQTRLFDPSRYKRLLNINANLFLRTMALMFVFAFITAQGARMSDVILAVNALLMNFQLFLSYALDGIAYSAEALVGKAVGSRDRNGMLLAVKRTLLWSFLFSCLFCLVYLLVGEYIIDLLTSIESIRLAAREFLPWLIIAPLISVWSFLYDGVFVGATRSKEMMLVMVGSMLVIFLPTWLIFNTLGNHGLWLAFMMFMAARGLGMHFWFRRMLQEPLIG